MDTTDTMDTIAPLQADQVQAFVGSAHGDLARVTDLLTREPHLVNAAWDWGGGDWETALGAAAHMGRADIARYLLAHGARLDVFAAAMLGHVEVVAAIVGAYPDARAARGPHGIPLLDHAHAGGATATAVVALLQLPDGQMPPAASD